MLSTVFSRFILILQKSKVKAHKYQSNLCIWLLVALLQTSDDYGDSHSDAVQNYIAKCRGTAVPCPQSAHVTETCYICA
jgi:hypothetical protein